MILEIFIACLLNPGRVILQTKRKGVKAPFYHPSVVTLLFNGSPPL